MRLRLINCKKSRIFHKKCARTFAQIRSKPKNACNIHNIKLACKKNQPPTKCKICGKMTHNETAGYLRASQSALKFIWTPEMNSSCPITYKSTYNM